MKVFKFMLSLSLVVFFSLSCERDPFWKTPPEVTDEESEMIAVNPVAAQPDGERNSLAKDAASDYDVAYSQFVCLHQQLQDGIAANAYWDDPEQVKVLEGFWDRVLSAPGYTFTAADHDTLLFVVGIDAAAYDDYVAAATLIVDGMIAGGVADLGTLQSEPFLLQFLADVDSGDCSDPSGLIGGEKGKIDCCWIPSGATYDEACINVVCNRLRECINNAWLQGLSILSSGVTLGTPGGFVGTAAGFSAGTIGGAIYVGWKRRQCRLVATGGCSRCIHMP